LVMAAVAAGVEEGVAVPIVVAEEAAEDLAGDHHLVAASPSLTRNRE
jgi:hypothetical protein